MAGRIEQIKQAGGSGSSSGGLVRVGQEWVLVTTAHNILKIHAAMADLPDLLAPDPELV